MLAKKINERIIHVYDKGQFDWPAIRNCGQIFIDPPVSVVEGADKWVLTAHDGVDIDWVWNYFDLDTDYNAIRAEILRTLPATVAPTLRPVIEAGRGIRILRQDFVRTVISFIISANNNIKRFSKTIAQIDFNDLQRYTADDFRAMGCGYRAPYLTSTIKTLHTKEFVEALGSVGVPLCVRGVAPRSGDGVLPTGVPDPRRVLMTLSGVGPKVADCILLFALHRLDVAPVDTWIQKATARLGNVFVGPYAGVLQQYIFYYLQYLKKTF